MSQLLASRSGSWVRWALVRLALGLGIALSAGSGSQAQDPLPDFLQCKVKAGDWVDTDQSEGVAVGYVVSVNQDLCAADVRMQVADPSSFDPYLTAIWEVVVDVLPAPPENAKPYACPFAVGEPVDVSSGEDAWYPAEVLDVDQTCAYTLAVWQSPAEAQQAKIAPGEIASRMRTGALKPPTEEEQAAAAAAVEAAKLCPAGGTEADYQGDEADLAFKRFVIADLQASSELPISVEFEQLRAGSPEPINDGGSFLARNPDARVGGTSYPYRISANICTQKPNAREIRKVVLDYSCFTDKFDDFVCRKEAERSRRN